MKTVAFHTLGCKVNTYESNAMLKIFNEAGYQELSESQKWSMTKGGKYYVTRNQSSLIAFHIGEKLDHYNFQIVASHSDSPTFKLKEKAEMEVKNHYLMLNTEGYGGMICSSWFDRPLSIAGRVMINGKTAKAGTDVKVGDVIEIGFGTRNVKVEVLDVQETTRKEDAKELFRYL